jgi:hypothetical protein
MRDLPDAGSLVNLARQALDALPALSPAAQREEVALIARCLAIAERELAFGTAAFADCRMMLAALYGAEWQEELLARLAADIAAGAFDRPGSRRDALHRLLWRITVQKLGESNPEYLACNGPG